MIKFFNFLKKPRLYKILVLERVETLKYTLKYRFICKIDKGDALTESAAKCRPSDYFVHFEML